MDCIVTCPQCGSRNRIRPGHTGQAVCGRCKTPLSTASCPAVEELSDATLPGALAANPTLVVDFWAPWCGPCRMMSPVVEQFARRHPALRVAKFDTQANPAGAAHFAVSSIPCLVVFQQGKEVKRVMGAMSLAELEYHLHSFTG
jgi:thioredoxin 2